MRNLPISFRPRHGGRQKREDQHGSADDKQPPAGLRHFDRADASAETSVEI